MTKKSNETDKDGAELKELNSSQKTTQDKSNGEKGASVLSEINEDDDGKPSGSR